MSKSHSCRIKLEPIITKITPPRIIKTAVLPGKQAESLFIATPDGEISTVEHDSSDWYLESFLDIRDLAMEDGLHGFEFHSDFNENGRFYLHYSVRDSESIDFDHYDTIEEWILLDTGIPICVRTLLNIKYPFSNHNGTNTLSWNNGCLILLTGDGGSSYNQVQKNTSLLGKVVAVNVDYRPWKFAKDPPPVSETDELDPIRRASLRIVAKGLENPSGFEVDGPIKYLTDAGQNDIEKVMVFSRWKKNFGCEDQNDPDYHHPTVLYSHRDVGRGSHGVIGGCVYRGDKIQELNGRYIFADADGGIFTIRSSQDDRPQIPCLIRVEEDGLTLTALGSNRRKTRIFVGGYNNGTGGLYELVPQ